jgi:hypothetical protein
LSKLITLLLVYWRRSCLSLQDLVGAFSLVAAAAHPVLLFPSTVSLGALSEAISLVAAAAHHVPLFPLSRSSGATSVFFWIASPGPGR